MDEAVEVISFPPKVTKEGYFVYDRKGNRSLSKEQAVAFDRLRKTLSEWLDPDQYQGEAANVMDRVREIISSPVGISGRMRLEDASPTDVEKANKQVWATLSLHNGKTYPVLWMTAEANRRLLSGEGLVKPGDEALVGWAREFDSIITRVPQADMGKENASLASSLIFSKHAINGERVDIARVSVFE